MWKESKHRNLLKVSGIASVVIGLAAHGFAYSNATYFHDRVRMFFPIVFDSAIRAKWMAQFTNLLTGYAYLPWLFGVWTIIFFTLSVYMIADILAIRYNLCIWLIAGLFITNSAVINAHLYWPCEMLAALPFAIASVWIWKKEKAHIVVRISAGAFFIGLSLASYGAYTSVGPCAVVIALLFELLDGEDWRRVFKRGLEYIAVFLAGMIFYYAALRLFLHFQNLEILNYMGENRLVGNFPGPLEIFDLIKRAWYSTVVALNENIWSRLMLLLSAGLLVIRTIRQRERISQPLNYIMMVVLIGVLPLGAGLIYVMAFGNVHDLMKFAHVMPFVVTVVLLDREFEVFCNKKAGLRESGRLFAGKIMISAVVTILTILLCVNVYQGILSANEAYMQANKLDTVNKSLVTRILGRVENCEGFEGNELLIVAGNIAENKYLYDTDDTGRSTWDYWGKDIQMNGKRNGLTYNVVLETLLWTQGGWNNGVDDYQPTDYSPEEQETICEMPSFPADGSVRKIGDTVVVKLSDLADGQ